MDERLRTPLRLRPACPHHRLGCICLVRAFQPLALQLGWVEPKVLPVVAQKAPRKHRGGEDREVLVLERLQVPFRNVGRSFGLLQRNATRLTRLPEDYSQAGHPSSRSRGDGPGAANQALAAVAA